MRSFVRLSVVALFVLLLGACGDDSSEGTAGAPRPTSPGTTGASNGSVQLSGAVTKTFAVKSAGDNCLNLSASGFSMVPPNRSTGAGADNYVIKVDGAKSASFRLPKSMVKLGTGSATLSGDATGFDAGGVGTGETLTVRGSVTCPPSTTTPSQGTVP